MNSMEASREDQKRFAKEIINISDRDASPETLTSLSKLTSLLVSWVGEENSIAVNLSEYIGEFKQIADGQPDTGWKDHNKETLDKDLSL